MKGSSCAPTLDGMSEQVPPASSGESSGASSHPHEAPEPAAAARPSRWNRPFLIGIAAGLGVVVLAVAAGISGDLFGGPGAFGGGYGYRGDFFFPGFFPFGGSLMMLLPLAVVVGAIWLLVAGLSRSNRARAGDSAHEILRQRYARGEITQEEYTRMSEVLRGDRRP